MLCEGGKEKRELDIRKPHKLNQKIGGLLGEVEEFSPAPPPYVYIITKYTLTEWGKVSGLLKKTVHMAWRPSHIIIRAMVL